MEDKQKYIKLKQFHSAEPVLIRVKRIVMIIQSGDNSNIYMRGDKDPIRVAHTVKQIEDEIYGL